MTLPLKVKETLKWPPALPILMHSGGDSVKIVSLFPHFLGSPSPPALFWRQLSIQQVYFVYFKTYGTEKKKSLFQNCFNVHVIEPLMKHTCLVKAPLFHRVWCVCVCVWRGRWGVTYRSTVHCPHQHCLPGPLWSGAHPLVCSSLKQHTLVFTGMLITETHTSLYWYAHMLIIEKQTLSLLVCSSLKQQTLVFTGMLITKTTNTSLYQYAHH